MSNSSSNSKNRLFEVTQRALQLTRKAYQLISNPNFRHFLITVTGINFIYDTSPLTHGVIIVASITAGSILNSIIEKKRFKPNTIDVSTINALPNEIKSKLNYFKTNIKQLQDNEMPLFLALQSCSDFLTFSQLGYYFVLPQLAWIYPHFLLPVIAIVMPLGLYMNYRSRKTACDGEYKEYANLLAKVKDCDTCTNPTHPFINFIYIIIFLITQTCFLNASIIDLKALVTHFIYNFISMHSVIPITACLSLALYYGAYDYFKNGLLTIVFGQGMISSLNYLSHSFLPSLLRFFKLPSFPTQFTPGIHALNLAITFAYSYNNFQERNRKNIIEKLVLQQPLYRKS